MAYQINSVLDYTVSVFNAMPLVNTIILKDDDVIDVEKENIYPLVSINLQPSPAPDYYFRKYNLEIGIYNQRDDRKIATPSKLLTDTNYVDNIAICDTIANNFVMELMKSHNEFNILLNDGDVSDFEFIRKEERNRLDGVKFRISLLIKNNEI